LVGTREVFGWAVLQNRKTEEVMILTPKHRIDPGTGEGALARGSSRAWSEEWSSRLIFDAKPESARFLQMLPRLDAGGSSKSL
jgi:hypothetical protein